MWQQFQSLRWLSALVALMLLAACSQTERQLSEPHAITTQTVSNAPLLPSAHTPASELVAPRVASAATIAPTTVRTVGKPQAPIAVHSSARSELERTPTFQATPRMAGFSPDSHYFIYLESSRDTGAGVPKSTLQLVDLVSNQCVADGCIETRYSEEGASTKTTEAENNLLQQTWKVRQDLNLTPPVAGTNLPILFRSRTADGSETVTVQPTNTSQMLQLHLRQKKAPDQAAMELEVTYNGQRRSLDSLSHFRTNVLDYAIRQVTLSPNGKRVVVLLTATQPTFEGTLGTTLVQGFEL